MDLNKLNHPHIIRLISAYRHGENYSLIFPLADMSLRDMMKSNEVHKTHMTKYVKWIATQLSGLASGLSAMHNTAKSLHEKITRYHHDVKPENILLFEQRGKDLGTLSLSDFGLGRSKDRMELRYPPYSNTPVLHGTRTYGAPECFYPQELELKTRAEALDVWSLGVCISEVLTWMLHGKGAHRMLQ